MQTRIPSIFKVSVLSAAMVTLSGCAVTSDPSRIGESIMSAGRITADASVKAYEGTKRVLGFDRLERQQPSDDVDMALMDGNSVFPPEDEQIAVVLPVDTDSALRVEPLAGIEQPPLGAPAIATMPAVDPNAIPVATIDYNHSVGANETMWTIAKTTTGNANNWRILAEINQLDINSPMQIGQEILIPADLVLPELVAGLAPQTVVPSAADEQVIGGTLEPIAAADLISNPIPNADSNGLVLGAANEEIITEDSLVNETLVVAAADADPTTDALVPAAPTRDPSIGAIALKADAGETLWDMAKRTTGDALNWKKIAEQNNFTEQDIGRIRYGQTIYVPVEMAKAELGGEKLMVAKAPAVVAEPKTPANADAEATDQLIAATTPAAGQTNQEAVDASAALVASASDLMDETKDIKIVEAKFQSDETIVADPADVNAAGQVIMVSGTYYPKAVYNEADFSSSLLMRVSPGTQMTVTRAMGPWFEVQTEFGIGYMHSRDIK